MLKFPGLSKEKIKVEHVESNPQPTIVIVSSLVPHKNNAAMDKSVKFSDEDFKAGKLTQFHAALAAQMGAFAIGSVLSYTATALPKMRESGELGHISIEQESWISSLVPLAAAAACPLTGWLIERFGRRMTMLLLTLPFLAGWLLIFFAQNIAMVCAGRVLTGFCSGSFSIAAPIFVAETSEAEIRGKLSAGFDLMITVGMLFIFVIGTLLSWRLQALACAVIPILFHLLMYFVPESPRYLIAKGRESEAASSLMWLRGACLPEQIQGEFMELVNSINETSESSQGGWRNLCNNGALKPVLIGIGLFVFQVVCGIDAVLFYTVDIFTSAGSSLSAYYSTIVIGVVQVVAALSSALVVDKLGRRVLLMASEIFMVLSLGSMGAFYYIDKNNHELATHQLGWLPLTSLVVFVVAFSIGLGPIPYLIMGEILPLNIKGLGSSILTTIKWILTFGMTFTFNHLQILMGQDGIFWAFSACSLLGAFFVFTAVPETKGKSLEEIQNSFTKSKVATTNNNKIQNGISQD